MPQISDQSSSWPLNVHVIAEFPTGADTLILSLASCTGLSVSVTWGFVVYRRRCSIDPALQ